MQLSRHRAAPDHAETARTRRSEPVSESATQSERGDQRAVAVDVDLTQVLQQPAALTDQQQASSGVVVLLVVLEMLGEPLDALREQRDLNFRGAGVALVRGVFGNDSLLDIRL